MNKRRIVEDHNLRDNFFPLRDETRPIIPAFKSYSEKAFKEEELFPLSNAKQINSLIIGFNIDKLKNIKEKFNIYFPYITVKGAVNSLNDVKLWVKTKSIDLIFLDSSFECIPEFYVLCQNCTSNIEIIYISEKDYYTILDIKQNPTKGIKNGLSSMQLLDSIKRVCHNIIFKNEFLVHKNLLAQIKIGQSQKDIVGIPTVDGFEFMPIEHIICCEGMQKCTNIITLDKLNILSSYNIGEFRKLLQPFGFFSPHKSFLINLSKIKKYHKEGTLTMSNGQNIPLARRRKENFMNLIKRDVKFPIIPQEVALLPI
nr:LytTR family DNA-binding domain-containing protein [uncultured Psychroserpens sp.]